MKNISKNIKALLLLAIPFVLLFIILPNMFLLLSTFRNFIDNKFFEPMNSINYFIEKQNKNYDEIYELNCVPEVDKNSLNFFVKEETLRSDHYDMLEKLVNLKKIKLDSMFDEETMQQIFSELAKLKKLETVEIVESPMSKIDKLGDIENLKTLSIKGHTYGGNAYTIQDLDLLATDSRFNKIQSLTLNDINLKEIPDLTKLENLQNLSVSGLELDRIDIDAVKWENIKSLKIGLSHITEIDESIVKRLINLETLDISYSDIKDVNFILEIPSLQKFVYLGLNKKYNYVDLEPVKKHPNYTNKWTHNYK